MKREREKKITLTRQRTKKNMVDLVFLLFFLSLGRQKTHVALISFFSLIIFLFPFHFSCSFLVFGAARGHSELYTREIEALLASSSHKGHWSVGARHVTRKGGRKSSADTQVHGCCSSSSLVVRVPSSSPSTESARVPAPFAS